MDSTMYEHLKASLIILVLFLFRVSYVLISRIAYTPQVEHKVQIITLVQEAKALGNSSAYWTESKLTEKEIEVLSADGVYVVDRSTDKNHLYVLYWDVKLEEE